MYLETYLVAEKELDGKPFTVCEMDAFWAIELALAREADGFNERETATRLYNAFHTSQDETERGILPSELNALQGNGVFIIPKTKDRIIPLDQYQ